MKDFRIHKLNGVIQMVGPVSMLLLEQEILKYCYLSLNRSQLLGVLLGKSRNRRFILEQELAAWSIVR